MVTVPVRNAPLRGWTTRRAAREGQGWPGWEIARRREGGGLQIRTYLKQLCARRILPFLRRRYLSAQNGSRPGALEGDRGAHNVAGENARGAHAELRAAEEELERDHALSARLVDVALVAVGLPPWRAAATGAPPPRPRRARSSAAGGIRCAPHGGGRRGAHAARLRRARAALGVRRAPSARARGTLALAVRAGNAPEGPRSVRLCGLRSSDEIKKE